MRMRLAKILDAKSYTADVTEVINILVREPISALHIEARSLNSSNTPAGHPAKLLSKVEILDGSRVLHSLSGLEIQARQFYCLKHSPENVVNYQNDVYCTADFVIPFGRFLGDKLYCLDPLRFSQLQLRISVDIGASGSTCDAAILDIDAYVFDEAAVNPVGFLSAKEHYRYSLVSSAIEDIDLPRDRILRALYIHSLYTGKYPYEQYNKVKISEDNDRRIPYDFGTSRYMKFLAAQFGKCEEHLSFTVDTSGIAAYVMPTYEVFAEGIGQGGTALYFTQTAGNGGTVTLKGNAGGLFQGLVKGCAPHGTILLPFGDMDTPEDWYDLSKVGSLRAKVTAGSSVGASSECAIVAETVEPY